MNTILTDDEIDALELCSATKADVQDIEAAVLAKLAQQEPVAWQYRMRPTWGKGDAMWGPWEDCTEARFKDYQRVSNLHDWEYQARALYTHPAPQQDDQPPIKAELHCLCGAEWGWVNRQWELRESPQQADRQRVPIDWSQAGRLMEAAMSASSAGFTVGTTNWAAHIYRAMLDAAPEAPEQAEQAAEPVRDEREPSPTAGMSLAQRILHVGGRNNAAGYVEFGSTQAVEALVRHVLRDLPDAPPAQASAVDERAAFEAWYSQNAFNFERDPIGSRECGLQWEAWQSRAALAQKGGAA